METCRCGDIVGENHIVINGEAFCSYTCAGELAPYTVRAEIDRLDAQIAILTEHYDQLQSALVLPVRVVPEPKAEINATCEICGKEPAVTVACSSLGAVLYKYGTQCLATGAEPFGALCAYLKSLGGRGEVKSNAMHAVIDATLLAAGKTIKELDEQANPFVGIMSFTKVAR
jgi:hypothetical protein